MENFRSEYICHYDRYLPALVNDNEALCYMSQVYNYLELMEPGTRLNLRAEGEKLKWLLVAVGAFLFAEDHWLDFDLNDDYTKLRRTQLPPGFRERMRQKSTSDNGS